MKCFDKSFDLSVSLLGGCVNKKTYHFSFIFKRNKLISIGQNKIEESPKVVQFARRHNIEQMKKWPYLHSEIDAISKVWGRIYLDSTYTIVNVRLSKKGELRMSKPCASCHEVISCLGIKVVYSTEDGYEIL